MKKLRSLFLILSAFMWVLAGCGNQTTEKTSNNSSGKAGSVPGVTDTEIKIGAVLDMSGPIVTTTAPYIQGYKDYFQFVNENGGVNGRKIVYNVMDDQYKVDKTLTSFRKLIDDGTFAIAGQVGTNQYSALEPEITKEKIPVFGSMQTMEVQTKNPYTFNMSLSYSNYAKIFAKRIKDTYKGSGKPKVAFLGIDVFSSAETYEFFKKEAKAAGIDLVLDQRVPSGTTDFTPQVMKIKQSGADYVVQNMVTSMYVTYLKDANRLGASDIPPLTVYTGLNEVLASVGKEAYGNLSAAGNYFQFDSAGKGTEEMLAFAKKNNRDLVEVTDTMYIQAWTSAKVFVEGLKRAGKDLTRESFIKALEGIENFDTGGLSHPVTFGPNDHNGVTDAKFFTYDFTQKKLVPLDGDYSAE